MGNDLVYNSARRLPIVFCLDVSPSMAWPTKDKKTTSIELTNTAVSAFIKELRGDINVRRSAEIAFVTFSTNIELNTEFQPINSVSIPNISAVESGGTNMAMAIIEAINKIDARRNELEENEIPYYAPFLVLVTDGDPDDTDEGKEKAMKMVKDHCVSEIGAEEIIIPFIIGVGDHINSDTLQKYAEGFTSGYFPIKTDTPESRMAFSKVFKLIGNSTRKTVDLKNNTKEAVVTVRRTMNDFLSELAGI